MDSRNFTYMFYGFAVAWMVPLIYIITLAFRERSLRQELDRVKRMLHEHESGTEVRKL